jgi:hypothetical protein
LLSEIAPTLIQPNARLMNFYLFHNGAQVGPFTEAALREMLANGQATPDMLAWREGMPDWAPLGQLLGQPAVPASAFIPHVPAAPAAKSSSDPLRILKGCLMGFGVLAAVVAVVGALGFGLIAFFGTGFDKSSKAYVDDAVPQIVSNWSADELTRRVAPEYMQLFKKADIESLFQKMSQRLGPMQKYGGSTGDSKMNFSSGGGTVSATYVCHATFKGGDATINVVLVRSQGQWMIAGFHVESSAFL